VRLELLTINDDMAILIDWDEEDEVYVAMVPDPECSSFGSTREEALAMAIDAVDVTLDGLETYTMREEVL